MAAVIEGWLTRTVPRARALPRDVREVAAGLVAGRPLIHLVDLFTLVGRLCCVRSSEDQGKLER